MAEEEGLVRCQNRLRLGQNEPVVKLVEYADSHLSQRRESRIHVSCKSAGEPGTAQTVGPCIDMPPRRRVFVAEDKISELRQSSWLYSQTPLLFWRAMAVCIAIGLRTTNVHWLIFLSYTNQTTCSYNCVIEIGFSWKEKKFFSHTASKFNAVRVKYRKGTDEVKYKIRAKIKKSEKQWV